MRHPALPWVLPFAVFMLLLAAAPKLGLPPLVDLTLRLAIPALGVLIFSRHLLSARFASFLPSVLVGVGVFVLWVAPDLLFAGWRSHWLFQNAIVGTLESTLPPEARSDWLALSLRIARAALLVPIVEELFWRGWLMRWIINPDFEKVPLGAYAHASFWLTAALFSLEHGSYWEVGFLAGAVYNWWMVRTKSVSDLILAHAVTNACLAAFVLLTGRWEFWM
ncbi:MAG: CAAX prenyl protease-related protein [Bryobacteraceae bacterium]|nr:CAAX prenyl protease-related protein [Bryobacteraceae bacterium]